LADAKREFDRYPRLLQNKSYIMATCCVVNCDI
jgi:hypothetical protein